MYVHVYVGLYVNFNINIEGIFFFFFLSNWDAAPLRDGALRRLRTLHIVSGGTD